MNRTITTAVLVGALALPVVGLAAAPAARQVKEAKSKATVASHATTGVVKSVDATTLVITKSGKMGGEMTFVLNPSTKREGTIEVGSQVSVRYQEEGKTLTATAITVGSKPAPRKKG